MEADNPTPAATEQLPRSPDRRRKLRLMIGGMLVVIAVGLVPWTLYLAATLPDRHHASNWQQVWVGFDVALAIAIMATAVGAFMRANWLAIAATVTGTLLLCDAWFDVLTSGTGREASVAIASGRGRRAAARGAVLLDRLERRAGARVVGSAQGPGLTRTRGASTGRSAGFGAWPSAHSTASAQRGRAAFDGYIR